MPCCCKSDDAATVDNKSMKTMYSGNAPGREAMNRGNNTPMADADSQAVDWWRHHQHGNGSAHVMSKNQSGRALATQPATNGEMMPPQKQSQENPHLQLQTSEQRIRNQIDGRDPNQTPYNVQKELPVRSVNGDTMHPHLLPTETTRESNGRVSSSLTHLADGSSGAVEVCKPQVDQNSSLRQARQRQSFESTTTDQQSDEHMAFIARVDSVDRSEGRFPVDPPGTPTRSYIHSRKQFDSMEHSFEESQRKKLPLSKFIEKKSKNAYSLEESDHLSDVPSDVDSVIKERYLVACQMLKTTMIQKDKSLIPIEKEYILSLLGDMEKDGIESVVSEDQVSAIERATLRLESDPIFQQPVLAKSRQLQDPPSLKRISSSPKDRSVDELDGKNDKNPHTATRKPKNKLLASVTNACNPSSVRGARGEVSHDVHIIQQDQPQYDEEWDDPELNDRSKGELVRFDGWSFQRSNEYPFLILGADGDYLDPRVMTPAMMEALRGFMPFNVSESNFWLKYSLVRDGASLASLLAQIRGSTYTMIGVETNRGEVFGSFTGTPWRIGGKWFGNGEAFLWRLKKPRYTSPLNSRKPSFEREMEVYPYTGYDELVQYCTPKTIAVGGGDWIDVPCPYDGDTHGIGFMIDGDLAGGETNSCSTFANPRLAKQTTASSEFSITNLEVWTLTPCLTVQDAARMEMQKLFLDEQGAHIMRG
ncbi:TLD domain containing protein [Nitzschia inconspicua]|uniref:Oxidation resistance protein 1 n=1 Tax=Nitzschia inconspicua TaxID=303405 RepID=A0A9K3LCG9_9STRA|nr:TLD domain containing protein [Nitzschia inconspicua]